MGVFYPLNLIFWNLISVLKNNEANVGVFYPLKLVLRRKFAHIEHKCIFCIFQSLCLELDVGFKKLQRNKGVFYLVNLILRY